MSTTTLRALNGFDETPASLTDATLILIDYQNTYTRGVMELFGWQAALDSAAALLRSARAAGTKVIHVINDGGEGTPYDIRAEIGRIHPSVAPIEGEPVVVKTVPNGFLDTELGELVDAAGHKDVIVAGFMTHMCVAFTAQGAFLRGNRPTVVADACATRTLQSAGTDLHACQIHNSALATISDLEDPVRARRVRDERSDHTPRALPGRLRLSRASGRPPGGRRGGGRGGARTDHPGHPAPPGRLPGGPVHRDGPGGGGSALQGGW